MFSATYLQVAPLIQDGVEFVGPETHMRRMVFWSAIGGIDIDLDAYIAGNTSWLNEPGYAAERTRQVAACEFLKEKAKVYADGPKWDLPDNPFDISEWLDVGEDVQSANPG
jgi:hypothetical protein